ncbi:hypothetical protein [Palleronia sp.]|uniref:hypothetical protein n=1 Tax=Palleronia sp. TaxID=1940284 RepID=UPI0035C87589
MLELLAIGVLVTVGQGALAFEAPAISAHGCGAPRHPEMSAGWLQSPDRQIRAVAQDEDDVRVERPAAALSTMQKGRPEGRP